MKKSKYESLWESPKHDKTFSDAIEVSLYRLQKKKLLIDSTEDEISDQSIRLGVKIFKAIMNVRKSFLMKEKLKELNVKLKENKEEEEISEDDIQNESMCIDHQQVSETLDKHQKSFVYEISESESDVPEMNNDQTINNSTYSLGYDEEVEEYSTMDENQMLLSNDNNKLKCTSSAVILSEQNIQQVDTGGVKRKLMDNDSNLLTTQNKRLCVVETSINQQSGPSSTSAPKNYALKEKTLDRSLHNEQNAWKPIARLQINNITPDYETQALYKKVQCILNQLTAENMDKLTQEVKDLNINTRERLQGVVNLIFDKAINEPNSTAIYTVMCKKLADMQVDMRQENETSFHILLLAHCRHEFKNTTIDKYARDAKLKEIRKCNDIEKKKKLISSLIDADRPLTGKAVGNIRFIGELFKQDMLKTSIIDRYIKDLLTPVDYNIECLCKLLTTIGAKLEKSMNNNFDYYFNRMSSLASNEKLSSRVRYMVQDVIDLRAQNWIPKRDDESYPTIMNQFNNNGSQQYHTQKAGIAEKATPRLPVSNETNDSPIQAFHEKVRDILNKLTRANIGGSTQQIKLLGINTHEKLKCVVDLVFEKAIDEPNFEAVCAALCEHMRQKLCQQKFVVDDIKQNNNKKQRKRLTFQALLSARCENEFESATVNEVARRNKLKEIEKCNDIVKKKELTVLLNNADHLSCIKSARYYKFIGELFNCTLIRKVFLKKCANFLLTIPDERKIECLCELLKTIGQMLETSNDNHFNCCFQEVNSLALNEQLSSRVRCMLQDVIDLRARQWEPIRDENNTMKHVDEERASSKKDDKNIEGELKVKATKNVAIATSTSMEANPQTSIRFPGYWSEYRPLYRIEIQPKNYRVYTYLF
ncbi:uncharacterized protein LOC122853769 [Aphidius gifuensis]|uniref:uncharacterized protein LOC122853769 n=1 Tax=Aphidius gifuensis TaxID=684658 RepID=UPI001CDB6487|nr:uncharacterized protein LOC122853769 [Aphidius gifuensis]